MNLHCGFQKSLNTSLWLGEVQVLGTGAAPEVVGTVWINQDRASMGGLGPDPLLQVKSNGYPLSVNSGSVTFRAGAPIEPTLDFQFEGYLNSLPFHASILGPLNHRISFIDSDEARQILRGDTALFLMPPAAETWDLAAPSGQLRPLIIPWGAGANPTSSAKEIPAADRLTGETPAAAASASAPAAAAPPSETPSPSPAPNP